MSTALTVGAVVLAILGVAGVALWTFRRVTAAQLDAAKHQLARVEAEGRVARLDIALDLATQSASFWRDAAQILEKKLYEMQPQLGAGLAPDDVAGRLQRLEDLEHNAASRVPAATGAGDPDRAVDAGAVPDEPAASSAAQADSVPDSGSDL